MKRGDQSGAHSASRTGPKSGVTSATEPFNAIVKDCVRCSGTAFPATPANSVCTSARPHAHMVKYVFIFYYDIVVYDIVDIGNFIKPRDQATDTTTGQQQLGQN